MGYWLEPGKTSPSLPADDLSGGRRLELESLNGEVVRRRGEHDGAWTPLNFALYAALRPYVDGAPAVP